MASYEVPSLEKLLSCKLSELKKACKENSLPHNGTKAELAERLHIFHVTAAEKARLLADNEPNEAELLGELEEEVTSTPATETKVIQAPAVTESIKPVTKSPKTAKVVKSGVKRKVAPSKTPDNEKDLVLVSESLAPETVEDVKKDKTNDVEKDEITETPPKPKIATTDKESEIPKVPVTQLSDEERKRLRAERFASHLTSTDENMEARKRARAERFGLPYTPPKTGTSRGASNLGDASLVEGDLSRMQKRAARFGEVLSPALRQAREEEMRRKRMERFGVASGSPDFKKESTGSSLSEDEKKKRRLERFGATGVNSKDTTDEDRKRRRLERFQQSTGTPSETINQEKLNKRTERFGLVSEEAKKAARAARFGLTA